MWKVNNNIAKEKPHTFASCAFMYHNARNLFVPVGSVHVYVGSLNCSRLCVCVCVRALPFCLPMYIQWAYSIRFKQNRASIRTDIESTENTSHNSITRNKRKTNVSARHYTTSRTIDSYSSHPWRSAPMSCPLLFFLVLHFPEFSLVFVLLYIEIDILYFYRSNIFHSDSHTVGNRIILVFEWKKCIWNDGRLWIEWQLLEERALHISTSYI